MRQLSLRAQLTLFYAVPFLLSGTVLLLFPILGSSSTRPVDSSQVPPPEASVQDSGLASLLVFSAIGLILMTAISVALGWVIAGRFLRPLRTITATARDISASNLHRRLAIGGRDEFADLGATLDALFARLEASFEAQRRFVANASHELRSPLTAERALLQVTLSDPDATAEGLRGICQELLTLNAGQERLIAALLTLATSEQGVEQRIPCDLAEITRSALGAQPGLGDLDVAVSLRPAPVAGDPHLLESLTGNLIGNAVRHNVPGGTIDVSASTVDGRASLTVVNSGPVIPPERLAELFQPFQRLGGRRHDGGHGLGLAIVRAIADAHGAQLVPYARPEGGLQIQILFPQPLR
ncbi:sensor histidine kinase [Longispora albida]|uniref:sensor histidine kinase n=1 Tax=Longispora albida TaxID=203523 RepID=UPI00036E989E|nr:HAMP domain-containing sensor histidine kinase [Longispora albida]